MTTRRPPFECVALLLQGGGALGSYQAGVYQALAEAGLEPDWVAGISIGAINAALIAGNPPGKRVDALRAFWETVTTAPPLPTGFMPPGWDGAGWSHDFTRRWVNQWWAFHTMLGGAPGFFRPRPVPPFLAPSGTEAAQSFYDTGPLQSTLERLVDFDRLNTDGMRFSVGAVNVTSGNFTYFDTTSHVIGPRHVMASGALPPGFPAVEIDGDAYWDGGLVSNTPLQWVLEARPRQDILAFQVDLWSARGAYPGDLFSQEMRLKDIRFSSRTRLGTDRFRKEQSLRRALGRLMERLPESLLQDAELDLQELLAAADEKVYNIVQLVYRAKAYEGSNKDYEFSRATMEEHWESGYEDAVLTLRHPEVLQRPTSPDGVSTFDVSEMRRAGLGGGPSLRK